MTSQTAMEIPVKPRVLIADDSRIVRATLIKHIEGLFEFREALDGEEAWEMLLIDPSIRVVITDLTMPKLDGYGLLNRIRTSKIRRIRNLPVVVVSGSDEREERERAKAAGASDLITKGIATAQLLSRLDVLSKLVTTQEEFEQSLEALARGTPGSAPQELASADALRAGASILLANAIKNRKNFVLLVVRIGLRHVEAAGNAAIPLQAAVDAIGRLLRRTVRQTDLVAGTGPAEFTLATGNISFDAARIFAQRVCAAIASAHLVNDERLSLLASCGVASLCDYAARTEEVTLEMLVEVAGRRAALGFDRGRTGVMGAEEEERGLAELAVGQDNADQA